RMLQELHLQFDIITSDRDLARYRLLILPDEVPVSADFAKKLTAFTDAGGALIASHKAGLSPDDEAFALAQLGVKRIGDAPYSPDFIVPGDALAKGMKPTGHVMYMGGLHVEALPGTETLAQVQ